MVVLSLPLTFTNSFWSQDYRRGVQVLYDKLEQGVVENEEIISFIKARAAAESYLAQSLMMPKPTGKAGTGFDGDDGASLLMAFRGLQEESIAQGRAHNNIAQELTTLVASPFEEWALGYKERLKNNKSSLMDDWLRSYEQAQRDVSKLKQQYLARVRKADEAEDDAKFAPTANAPAADKYTTSPRLRPVDRAPPKRSASVSERIAQRLKEIQQKSLDAISRATSVDELSDQTITPLESPEGEKEKAAGPPKLDKGKGREVEPDADKQGSESRQVASPPPESPTPPPKDLAPSTDANVFVLAGISYTSTSLSQLLLKAAGELPLRAVRFPLIGEYQDAFTGDEFVVWLKDNVAGLEGGLDKAEEMARDLTERERLLRRLGEFGNDFDDSDEAFYQFRTKAFELDKTDAPSSKPQPENLLTRTGNLYSLVSKALNTTTTTTTANHAEPAYVRARNEANEADKNYRVAVRRVDRHRLGLEERIEDALKLLQRWEVERLRAVKVVLLQYHEILSNLPKALEPSAERSGTLLAAFRPEQDLVALVERYRTGPFRPAPQVYESVAHEESDVVFGIDLRRWSEGDWYASFTAMRQEAGEEEEEKAAEQDARTKQVLVPPVLTALLRGLESAYSRTEKDEEKRKAWIYEVPLPAVHRLREDLNALPPGAGESSSFPPEMMDKFDAPVIAACVKLWLLELDPPLTMFEGWEEFRKVYQVKKAEEAEAEGGEDGGGGGEGDYRHHHHLEKVGAALQRLPRVHLYVLDAILKHLKNLVVATPKVQESDEVFFTKLALSMGRCITRPRVETELSIQDRHPTSLMMDLLTHYDALLPPTIARKKRESERSLPIRKRTAPIDMRLSRSKITIGADAAQLLAAQQLAKNPSLAGGNNKSVKSPELLAQSLPVQPQPQQRQSPAPAGLSVPPPPPHSVYRQMKTPPPPPLTPKLVPPPPPPPRPSSAAGLGVPPPPPPPPLANQPPTRPVFKEPPPELDDVPPRPAFVDPAPEDGDGPGSPSPPATKVIPPTPQKGTISPGKIASRSPTPPNVGLEDVVLGTGKASISRGGPSSSSIGGGGRGGGGGRISRSGARPLSGNVQHLVQRMNNSGSPGPGSNSRRFSNSSGVGGTGTGNNSGGGKGSGSSSPVRRPSSIVGRNATTTSFSRRTMASDAEDDLVDKK